MHFTFPTLWRRRTAVRIVILGLALVALAPAAALAVSLPPPDPGSFVTVFDFLPDGRIVAYPGSQVLVQSSVGSSNFVQLGTVPPQFAGGSDAAFIEPGPAGLFFLFGSGAGGAQFGDPQFNGNVFFLPATGGVADRIAQVPFHAFASLRQPLELFLSRADDASFATSGVVRLDFLSDAVTDIVTGIPGASGGVGFDAGGNLYTGIGFDFAGVRTGEIRRFPRPQVQQALTTGQPIPFDDGQFVAQVLTAAALVFDLEGHLWVSGGDLFGPGESGFIAEIDPDTGQILRRVDPSDGDPDGGPAVFFNIAITDPISCTVGAVDEFDPARTVFFIDACPGLSVPKL